MKRRLWIFVLGAIVVLAVGYAIRVAERRASSGIAALLPRNTVAFAHLPDFNETMAEWRRSDIYQIYLESAVQEFLQKPISRSAKTNGFSARLNEIEELDAKDMFVALTSIANDKPKVVGGFQFGCNQTTADRVIGSWRAKINPSSRHERVAYQKHDIDVFTEAAFSVAMVQDQKWFFASNDVEELKSVLDRADGRLKDADTMLTGDEAYRDAIKTMPTSYALLAYFQPRPLVERLTAATKSGAGTTANQYTLLQQIRSACAATRFDHGKLHDVVFVGMPKQEQSVQLSRDGVRLATRTTIAYAASVLDFSKQVGLLFPTGEPNVLGPAAQRISDALAAAGITATDWEAAFGSEFDLLSDWPEQSRWPSVLLTAAVKDQARGKKIIDALTHGAGLDERWEQFDRDGAHYWTLVSASTWLQIRPVMALSDRVWITGLDMNSVTAAIQRAQKPEPGLADTENYRQAADLVPTPTKFFTYLDPALIYSRIDATVRPFLLMGAAFLPAANDMVDLTKVPPVESVTRHLSPIVSSQYYADNGYVAESIGPVTLNQAGIGVAVLGGMGAMAYHRLMPTSPNPLGGVGALGGSHHRSAVTPSPGVAGTPEPRATPTATPRQTP